ncbi:MAG TPA: hypothetical protein VK932_11070 [Kofleriaceae bacterium]|nr:hypothetical protein [Kofleriaceae bacterium]
MTIERAPNVGPARIDIAYERLGDEHAPPLLLIAENVGRGEARRPVSS